MMRISGILIGLTTSVILAADAAPSNFPGEQYVQYGALGILGVIAVWTLMKTIPMLSKAMTNRMDSHEKMVLGLLEGHAKERKEAWEKMDGWEKSRHEDSRILNETLTEMRVHCRETVAKIGQANPNK